MTQSLVAYGNARLIDPESGLDDPGELLTADGEIAELGPALFPDGVPEQVTMIDCGGRGDEQTSERGGNGDGHELLGHGGSPI